nr:conotoxin precursor O1 [Conus ebraeus]
MKLTCVVIVAVLFLTACQLITAEDSRGTQKHRTLRSTVRRSKSELTTRCRPSGSNCGNISICCGRCVNRRCT